jgi:aldose sugar dehydrogenase
MLRPRRGPTTRRVSTVEVLHARRLLLLSASLLLALAISACSAPGGNAGDAAEGPRSAATREGRSFQPVDFRVTTVVTGLVHPWSMTFVPGGDILVTERPGRLRRVRGGVLQPDPISGTPEVWAQGQGGLLEVALHPDFASNQLVYLTYSKPVEGGATTALFRGRLEGDSLVDGRDLFVAEAATGTRVHFGSRLVFDGDGHLFMTIGDRGVMEEAQNTSNHQGTVLRLTLDGEVPADNPFVGRSDVRPEIWSWGHRSPQGLSFHPDTGELWETEHGPQGGDELNVVRPGLNYGWPEATYGRNYGTGTRISEFEEKEGMESPVHHWIPSIGTSGLAIYDGEAFPEWQGDLFVGGLALTQVERIRLDGHQVVGIEILLSDLEHRIRDIRNGPDGYLYILVDAPDAPMLRLEPTT